MGKIFGLHCISFLLMLNFLFEDERGVGEYMYLNSELVKFDFLFRESCIVKIDVDTRTYEGGFFKLVKTGIT